MPVIGLSHKIIPVTTTGISFGTPAGVANGATFSILPAVAGTQFTLRKLFIHAANAGLWSLVTASGLTLLLFYIPNHESKEIEFTIGGLSYPAGTNLLGNNGSGGLNDYQFTLYYDRLVLA